MRIPILFLILTAVPAMVHAQTRIYEPLTSRGQSMGGAVLVTGTGMDSASLNPASMSIISSYVLDGAYVYADGAHLMGGAVTDTIGNRVVGASVYYIRNRQDDIYEGYRTGVAASVRFSPSVSVGINTYWQDFATSRDTRESALSFDGGFVVRLGTVVVGGVVFDIASDHDDNIPWRYGGGLAFLPGPTLALEGDVIMEGSDPWYRGGVEYMYGGSVTLRLGGGYRSYTDTKSIGGGLGYMSPGASLEFSVRRDFGDALREEGWYLGMGLRLYLTGGK